MTVADLIEALPYFRRFSGETIVIKYGGSLMDQPDAMSQFASDVALLRHVGGCPIVVHGGGLSDCGAWGGEIHFTLDDQVGQAGHVCGWVTGDR